MRARLYIWTTTVETYIFCATEAMAMALGNYRVFYNRYTLRRYVHYFRYIIIIFITTCRSVSIEKRNGAEKKKNNKLFRKRKTNSYFFHV